MSIAGSCRSLVDAWIDRLRRLSDEQRDEDAGRRRADDYSSARIRAAAALTIVLVVLLVLDVAVPDYDISPEVLLPLLGAILALLGLEASALWRGVR